ncbi:MAG: MBL fold metallo-hydrolase [Patescibacteria group bacterium]|nr:MBL fold metallo-hydrolase [Patescibacteria group bacterium]
MNIVWQGHAFFQITTNPQKNSLIKIAIDPYEKNLGLRLPKTEADVLLVTHQHYDHNNIKAVSGNPFLIEGPGEYDVKNIFVHGIPSFHDEKQGKERGENTIYVIESENLKICHMGDFGQKELTDEQLEKIGEVDILMIPVGGTYTISAQEALKIVSQIEPRITIPMHYSLPNLKIKLDPVSKFLKAFGLKSLKPIKKLSIKKRDLAQDEAKIIIMEK